MIAITTSSSRSVNASSNSKFLLMSCWTMRETRTHAAEQLIKQTWISPHFGVLSRYPCAADNPFPFIRPVVLPPHSAVKRLLTIFQLAATRALALALPASAQAWAVSAKDVAMQQVARETWVAFEGRLERAKVPAPQRPDYHRWTRFYLDFCHKYGHPPRSPTSLGPFLGKLAAKNQSVGQRSQAAG